MMKQEMKDWKEEQDKHNTRMIQEDTSRRKKSISTGNDFFHFTVL